VDPYTAGDAWVRTDRDFPSEAATACKHRRRVVWSPALEVVVQVEFGRELKRACIVFDCDASHIHRDADESLVDHTVEDVVANGKQTDSAFERELIPL
jgi:hypothetical protein